MILADLHYLVTGHVVPFLLAEGAHTIGAQTLTAQTGVKTPSALPLHVIRCRSVVLQNADNAIVGGHVVYNAPEERTRLCVAWVDEILSDVITGEFLGMLVRKCIIGEVVLPYRMPACTVLPQDYLFLTLEVQYLMPSS